MLEHSLDMPLRNLLKIQQQRIVSESLYHGIPIQKHPVDLWVYMELLYRHRPDVVIEIGTLYGGSALVLAHQMTLIGTGRVITVDHDHWPVFNAAMRHPRIQLITGDAVSVVKQVASSIDQDEKVMVIEDSSHTFDNTLAVMNAYGPLVTPGSYMIVEDTICGHGLNVGPAPGPYEAVSVFLEQNSEWIADRDCESFVTTWNPRGYLRKIGN